MMSESYSIILAILAAAAAGLIGAFALMKRTILAGDVMSHIAIPVSALRCSGHGTPCSAAVRRSSSAFLSLAVTEKNGALRRSHDRRHLRELGRPGRASYPFQRGARGCALRRIQNLPSPKSRSAQAQASSLLSRSGSCGTSSLFRFFRPSLRRQAASM